MVAQKGRLPAELWPQCGQWCKCWFLFHGEKLGKGSKVGERLRCTGHSVLAWRFVLGHRGGGGHSCILRLSLHRAARLSVGSMCVSKDGASGLIKGFQLGPDRTSWKILE